MNGIDASYGIYGTDFDSSEVAHPLDALCLSGGSLTGSLACELLSSLAAEVVTLNRLGYI